MLTLHHLNDSRSQRILWLLEELGTPYEMKRYHRDATTRLAPPELVAVHPLGKSPVITDGDIRIAESGAIVDYIIRRYGKGAMMPAAGSAEYEAYNEWLHYSEGSAMLPLMLNLYVSRLKEAGAPLHPRIDSEMANHLGDLVIDDGQGPVSDFQLGGRNDLIARFQPFASSLDNIREIKVDEKVDSGTDTLPFSVAGLQGSA